MSKEPKSAAPLSHTKDVVVTLDSVLDATQGMNLHTALSQLLENPAPVSLNASQVERVDTLALQVLLAFVMARRSAGQVVGWTEVSTEFRRATDLLGMSQPLGLVSL